MPIESQLSSVWRVGRGGTCTVYPLATSFFPISTRHPLLQCNLLCPTPSVLQPKMKFLLGQQPRIRISKNYCSFKQTYQRTTRTKIRRWADTNTNTHTKSHVSHSIQRSTESNLRQWQHLHVVRRLIIASRWTHQLEGSRFITSPLTRAWRRHLPHACACHAIPASRRQLISPTHPLLPLHYPLDSSWRQTPARQRRQTVLMMSSFVGAQPK